MASNNEKVVINTNTKVDTEAAKTIRGYVPPPPPPPKKKG